MNERTEYALDYGAGIMCVSSDPADAEEMQQFVPDSRIVARTVTEGEWEPVGQGEDPWEQIGVGIANAGPWIVNGVAGVYWRLAVVRDQWEVWQMPPDGAAKMEPHHFPVSEVTSVREVRVVTDDEAKLVDTLRSETHVLVPWDDYQKFDELVERAKASRDGIGSAISSAAADAVVRDLAALGGDE